MAFQFHLPDIGEGVVEGEIVAWRVKEGDVVTLDQPIVEVMTDKATVEIPSPRAGRISKINFQDGQICPVGAVLVEIEEEGGAARASNGNGHGHAGAAAARPAETPAPTPAPAPRHAAVAGAAGGIQVVDATPRPPGARVLATPATRRLARQLGVDLGRVPATGKRGRVTTDDVQRAAHAPPPAMAPARSHAPIAIPVGGDEERIPLRGLRKRIADNMARSTSTAAHFTYVEEVDMTELVAVRDRARARAAERGIKLTYLPFIIKAVVAGLKKWPQLNASLDEQTQEIVRKKYYHVGIAAQGPQGLAVSVLRDADRRSIFDLAREIERLGEAVKDGTASRDELTGSTFTITSLGKLGGVLATPIINFPEVGILGVHKIEERPAVRGGQIVARWLMNLSISLDHRLVDGWDGAMFLQEVKALLEDPTTMFMEMI
jgi:pyruvate dehydrogenase E2 component (dihydrolipoamide acetyltransferase)